MSRSTIVQISPRILEPRIPELGRIKIGARGRKVRSAGGKEFFRPEKLDHFRVTTRRRGHDENFELDRGVHAKVGERPTELDVRLLFDEPERNFRTSLAAYDGKQRICQGNGEEAYDVERGRIPCTCPLLKQHEGPYDGPKRPVGKVTCKPHGTLSVILEAAETFGGYYVFRTTSWETISGITAQLQLYLEQFGFLRGLPLRLVLYPSTDTYEDDRGNLKQSNSYKVGLVLRASFDSAYQLAAAAHERRSALQLPSGPAIAEIHERQILEAEEEEAEEIAAEFHPETQDGYEPATEAAADPATDDEREAEDLCRLAFEYLDWPPDRINRQIARYTHDLAALVGLLEEREPNALAKAREELERRRAPAAAEAAAEAEAAAPEVVDAEFELLDDADTEDPDAHGVPGEAAAGDADAGATAREQEELW